METTNEWRAQLTPVLYNRQRWVVPLCLQPLFLAISGKNISDVSATASRNNWQMLATSTLASAECFHNSYRYYKYTRKELLLYFWYCYWVTNCRQTQGLTVDRRKVFNKFHRACSLRQAFTSRRANAVLQPQRDDTAMIGTAHLLLLYRYNGATTVVQRRCRCSFPTSSYKLYSYLLSILSDTTIRYYY